MEQFKIFLLLMMGLALGCRAAEDEANKQLLERLCKYRRSAPAVTRVSEVESLIKTLNVGRRSSVKCSQGAALAIMSLQRFVDLKNVCSQASVDVIISFWELYIKRHARFNGQLPRQLKKFFIAYGMQVSKLCKKAMLEQLQKVSEERGVSEADINLVTEDVRKWISHYLGDDLRVENLLLVVQKNRWKPTKLDDEIAKVSLGPQRQKLFQLIKERCMKTFKPVYSSLITPIVRLAAVGLNYNGNSMRAQMKAFEGEKIYKDWFAAVVSCEIFVRIDIVEIPKQLEESDGTKKQITVLDEDDMRELKSKGLVHEGPKLVENSSIETIEVNVDDLILDADDADLIQSMQKYKYFLGEVDKFHLRMMKIAAKSAKDHINPDLIKWGLNKCDGCGKFKFTPGQKLLIGIIIATGVVAGSVIVGFLVATGAAQVLLVTFGFLLLLYMVGVIASHRLALD